MQKLSMNQKFNVPKNASYFRKSDAEETFERLDHPKSFYELSEEQRKQLLEWCSGMETIKRPNPHHTSYGLKHWFEASEGGFYVTNGQFKGAMILSGYSVANPDALNWTFNISQASYKEKRSQLKRLPI
ncbi:hypothetical protein [Enterococcus sp. BWR-S5]|uniref:hypothetical protein n=1 Tax=Enterococcus sp. BWR-S5 TaxID=2787714 RepID=UPI001920D58B|nr:hypothetical protein [Enterococcus sp. BWR-S5]MBL1223719.1 hypothetical protein [Enterococcus sp. BWR-S5]